MTPLDEPYAPNWDAIENFVGYGRADAPVVFVGMEEGLRSPDELEGELRLRSTYPTPVMDLRVASEGVAADERYFDPQTAPTQRTWRVMSDVMLRRHPEQPPNLARRRKYQALRLGRRDGDTLLCELLPYPSPRISDWPLSYAEYGRFSSREDYRAEMLPRRQGLLRDALAEHPRELVICYGKVSWGDFEGLFPDASWEDRDAFRVSRVGATRVVLSRHFSSRSFNSDEQLAALARVALE